MCRVEVGFFFECGVWVYCCCLWVLVEGCEWGDVDLCYCLVEGGCGEGEVGVGVGWDGGDFIGWDEGWYCVGWGWFVIEEGSGFMML